MSGEVRALLRGLGGGPAVPPSHRTLPSERGLNGSPTFASNVETFAQVGLLSALGSRAYAEIGSPDEPGTTLLTMHGEVTRPGVVEVPTGLPLHALLGSGEGPVLIGGYHGRWRREVRDLVVARPRLKEAGVPLNAGLIARIPADACPLAEVAAVAAWLAAESAGQCGPCLYGTTSVARDVHELLHGRGGCEIWHRLDSLIGRGACAHPDGVAAFVGSAVRELADELQVHARTGGCGRPYASVLPLNERVRA